MCNKCSFWIRHFFSENVLLSPTKHYRGKEGFCAEEIRYENHEYGSDRHLQHVKVLSCLVITVYFASHSATIS
jgi:hypothetical protein